MTTDDQTLAYSSQAERQRAIEEARRLREQAARILSPTPADANATIESAGADGTPVSEVQSSDIALASDQA